MQKMSQIGDNLIFAARKQLRLPIAGDKALTYAEVINVLTFSHTLTMVISFK